MSKCLRCERTLVDPAEWRNYSASKRGWLGRTHAREGDGGLCRTCSVAMNKEAQYTDAELRYDDAGWVRDGLILRPDPDGYPVSAFGEAVR